MLQGFKWLRPPENNGVYFNPHFKIVSRPSVAPAFTTENTQFYSCKCPISSICMRNVCFFTSFFFCGFYFCLFNVVGVTHKHTYTQRKRVNVFVCLFAYVPNRYLMFSPHLRYSVSMYFHVIIVCWFAFTIAVSYVIDSGKIFNLDNHLSEPHGWYTAHLSDKTVETV